MQRGERGPCVLSSTHSLWVPVPPVQPWRYLAIPHSLSIVSLLLVLDVYSDMTACHACCHSRNCSEAVLCISPQCQIALDCVHLHCPASDEQARAAWDRWTHQDLIKAVITVCSIRLQGPWGLRNMHDWECRGECAWVGMRE